jgi:hypothetical protein
MERELIDEKMNQNLNKCSHCNGMMPSDELTTDRRGTLVCRVCTEQALDIAITIKEFTPNGVNEFIWTDIFGFQEKHSQRRLFKIPAVAGYEWVNHSWQMTTHPDFVALLRNASVKFNDPSTAKLVAFIKKLTSGEVIPPFPIYINMTQVGGLHMLIDLIVHKEVVPHFKKWTVSIGLN